MIAPTPAVVAAPAVESPVTEDHLISLFDELAEWFGGPDDAATEVAAAAATGTSDDEIAAWFVEIAGLFEPDETPANARNLPVSPR